MSKEKDISTVTKAVCGVATFITLSTLLYATAEFTHYLKYGSWFREPKPPEISHLMTDHRTFS